MSDVLSMPEKAAMSASKPFLPTVCIDFDGVIHEYSRGWQKGKIYDGPVEGAIGGIIGLMCHYRVAIYSTRSKHLLRRWAMKRTVREWIMELGWHDTDLATRAWSAQGGKPEDYAPWTAGDVMDVLRELAAHVRYPLFKPPAVLTIDDRAVTFDGDWTKFTPEAVRAFKPWNVK